MKIYIPGKHTIALSVNDTAKKLYFKYLDYGFKFFLKNIVSIINNSYRIFCKSK